MDSQIYSTAIATIISSLVAAIAGMSVARHSTKEAAQRFYPERWFDRKVEAYTQVIENLHVLREDAESDIRHVDRYGELPAYTEESFEKFRRAYSSLMRLTDMGELLFSDDITEILAEARKVLGDPGDDDDPYEIMVRRQRVCQETLRKLRPLAKRDLRS